jgi:hypothetical protein
MEALRIRGEVTLRDAAIVTEDDVADNLRLVDVGVGDDCIRRQVLLVAIAFAFPQAKQPE